MLGAVAQDPEISIPVVIHRPGLVSAHSITGFASLDTLLTCLLLAIGQLAIIPESDKVLDMNPADFVARSLVKISQKGPSNAVYHLLCPAHRVSFSMIESGFQEYGVKLKRVSMQEFLKSITSTINPLTPHVEEFISYLSLPKALFVSTTKATAVLQMQEGGPEILGIKPDVAKYIGYLTEVGATIKGRK